MTSARFRATIPGEPVTLTGLGVVGGVGYAPVQWVRPRPELPTAGPEVPEDARQGEKERFAAAAATVGSRLASRASMVTGHASEVLAATSALATDRGWQRTVNKHIDGGASAEWAAVQATGTFVAKFEKIGGLMAERTTDLKDVRDRVIAELRGEPEPGVPDPQEPVVLLADDLAPADTAGLRPEVIAALVTALGGKTSHTAIIARQLGIPCVVAVGELLFQVEDGTQLLVDGETGELTQNPEGELAHRMVAEAAEKADRIRAWQGPAQTSDGYRVQLLANVQDGAAARKAAAPGIAEGVGLFRTELAFLSAQVEPTLEEQTAVYLEVFEAFRGHKVVVRTLDAGSDKPLVFANMPNEENPSLGVRGMRIALDRPELMTHQLDAIKAAAEASDVEAWVMAPMMSTVSEAEWFAGLCRERGLFPGVMVEVPGVALRADKVLEHVEFFSIGTNDLSQYTMAADRMSPYLSTLTDPWQPAVLRLVQLTAEAGQRAGKPVGVCGEAAADPLLACVLTGLGVTSLSAAAPALAAVGAQLSAVTLDQCRRAAAAAVDAKGSIEAREEATAILGG
ncbi:phosphoenolpyruvate--protein phosphotransferase [Raineyella antarctica]|uniref:Phosphoenolpyruvate-protein phosphotransferase n=1 Tax=Raineyella antarctica TaxID=1577474 RepID=A0A1G6GGJ9_9ACTN|nr:phosphoenolpyruvate--protein phosphotransferase [Raineyella antarctica]SDB81080.1 phosphoenolpyruvate--protein phosphotransferase [Raineyella antarctica]